MNDAEKVREALEHGTLLISDEERAARLAALDSILTELAETKMDRIELRSELREAEERAEKAEAKAVEVVAASLNDHNLLIDYEARIQELEAENDRLRQGLVEALEKQP